MTFCLGEKREPSRSMRDVLPSSSTPHRHLRTTTPNSTQASSTTLTIPFPSSPPSSPGTHPTPPSITKRYLDRKLPLKHPTFPPTPKPPSGSISPHATKSRHPVLPTHPPTCPCSTPSQHGFAPPWVLRSLLCAGEGVRSARAVRGMRRAVYPCYPCSETELEGRWLHLLGVRRRGWGRSPGGGALPGPGSSLRG